MEKDSLLRVAELDVHVRVGGVQAACCSVRTPRAHARAKEGLHTLVLLAPLQLDDDRGAHQAVEEGLGVDGCETLHTHSVRACGAQEAKANTEQKLTMMAERSPRTMPTQRTARVGSLKRTGAGRWGGGERVRPRVERQLRRPRMLRSSGESDEGTPLRNTTPCWLSLSKRGPSRRCCRCASSRAADGA